MNEFNTHSTTRLVLSLSTILIGAGCETESTEPDSIEPDSIEFRDQHDNSVQTAPNPGGGIWINNGLDDPDVSGVDPAFALSSIEGLDPSGDLLLDPSRHDTVRYLVECALPSSSTLVKEVDGEELSFQGNLGLAPEWEDGDCDEDCQQWVSACMLARTNVSAAPVSLWMRASHPAIGSGTSLAYPVYEASFFGNLFVGPDERYICQGSLVGSTVAFLDGRTCSNTLGNSCGFTKYTDCGLASRCSFTGLLAPLAIGCTPAGDVPHHTISTYVSAL